MADLETLDPDDFCLLDCTYKGRNYIGSWEGGEDKEVHVVIVGHVVKDYPMGPGALRATTIYVVPDQGTRVATRARQAELEIELGGFPGFGWRR